VTGKDITENVTFIEDNINLNTPIIITFEQRQFKIHRLNYVNQFECTWKYANYRKKKLKMKYFAKLR